MLREYRHIHSCTVADCRKNRRCKKTVIWFVWFVLFIWLNQTDQMNQINRINKTNQINQINQMNQTDRGRAGWSYAAFASKVRVTWK